MDGIGKRGELVAADLLRAAEVQEEGIGGCVDCFCQSVAITGIGEEGRGVMRYVVDRGTLDESEGDVMHRLRINLPLIRRFITPNPL